MSGNKQCARPGCGGAVAALLSYDYANQRIWLDDPGAETGGHHSALCAAHASRLRAPRGWSCQDRRTFRAAPSFPGGGTRVDRAAAAEPAEVSRPDERVPLDGPPPAGLPAGPEPVPVAAVPPPRDGGVIAGLTAIAV